MQASEAGPRKGSEVGWGGRRAGAGRKAGPDGGVGHHARPPHASRFPALVILRSRREAGSLRAQAIFQELRAALAAAKPSAGRGAAARVLHFGVREGEIRLLVEAHDARALARGIQGLSVRLARAVNRALGRRGPVWRHRYTARDLATPNAVRAALLDVLKGAAPRSRQPDACASEPWLAGRTAPEGPNPVSAPRTWLAGYVLQRTKSIHASGVPEKASKDGERSPRPAARPTGASARARATKRGE